MTFLVPQMLWLLPLGLLPILFHLFYRVRRHPRRFSSLLFFLAADPRLSARRRLREWLLLAVRCLLLLALLLALARPVRHGRGSGGVTLVAVIDNSASMQAAGPSAESRLARAVSAATLLCEDEAVAFAGLGTTVADPPASMPAGVTADRARLRAALGSIRPTHASGEPLQAIQAAVAAVRGARRAAGEVHLFTDLQTAEWARGSGTIELPPGLALLIHDVADEADLAGGVCIAALAPPARPLLAGRPWQARLLLRNAAGTDAEVILNLQSGAAGGHHRATVAVPGNGTREVQVAVKIADAGEQRIHAWLEGRAASAAAEAWLALPPADGAEAILVGGAAPHGLLAPALAPENDAGDLTGIRVGAVPPGTLADRLAAGSPPSLVAVTAEQLALAVLGDAVQACLREGGHVVVAPETGGTTPPPPLPAWCGMAWDTGYRDAAGGDWQVLDAASGFWDEIRGPDGAPLWREIQVFQAFPLRASDAEALAGLDGSRVLLARRRVGKGMLTVSGVAWDPRWSNLPHKAAFVALAQGMALAGLTGAPVEQGLAGQRFVWAPDAAAAPPKAVVEVIALEGDQGRWQMAPARARLPARAGVYQFTRGEATRLVAVCGDPRESETHRVRGETLPALAAVPHRVIRAKGSAARLQAVHSLRRGRSLFAPLLLVAVAALLAEMALEGWRRRERSTNQRDATKR